MPSSNTCQLPEPSHFSLGTTFKKFTCKGTLRQVFIIVYWHYWDTNSHVDIFDPALWVVAPLTFSLVSFPQPPRPPPPPPHLPSRCIFTVCRGGGNWGHGLKQINTCRKVPLQVNFFKWRHFAVVSNIVNYSMIWTNPAGWNLHQPPCTPATTTKGRSKLCQMTCGEINCEHWRQKWIILTGRWILQLTKKIFFAQFNPMKLSH
jgi:hypothetical protein